MSDEPTLEEKILTLQAQLIDVIKNQTELEKKNKMLYDLYMPVGKQSIDKQIESLEALITSYTPLKIFRDEIEKLEASIEKLKEKAKQTISWEEITDGELDKLEASIKENKEEKISIGYNCIEIKNIKEALSALINDVWQLHLNGRMTDSTLIFERYEKIGKILEGEAELAKTDNIYLNRGYCKNCTNKKKDSELCKKGHTQVEREVLCDHFKQETAGGNRGEGGNTSRSGNKQPTALNLGVMTTAEQSHDCDVFDKCPIKDKCTIFIPTCNYRTEIKEQLEIFYSICDYCSGYDDIMKKCRFMICSDSYKQKALKVRERIKKATPAEDTIENLVGKFIKTHSELGNKPEAESDPKLQQHAAIPTWVMTERVQEVKKQLISEIIEDLVVTRDFLKEKDPAYFTKAYIIEVFNEEAKKWQKKREGLK